MQEEQEVITNNEPLDPIQEAYDAASYDVKKYLSSEDFPKTVELIVKANRVNEEAEREINFICLMLALKIIKYDRSTGEQIMSMLSVVGLDISAASQVWSDMETYIIPTIPELGESSVPNNMMVNRVVPIANAADNSPMTHFGPDSVEMRLKNISAPRITLDQLSKGESLLNNIDANAVIKREEVLMPKAVNYSSHPDPYREMVEE